MIRAPNVPSAEAQRERLREAARSLESMVLKHLVTASGAFKGGDGPGAAIRSDLFATTLAESLAKGGGIGLAAQLERSLAAVEAPRAELTVEPRSGETSGTSVRWFPASTPRAHGLGPPPSPFRPQGPSTTDIATALPSNGPISSGFGIRSDPFTGAHRHHAGVDFAAPEGSEIRAARPGRVVSSGPRGGYGNAVEIDHGDGVTTLYAHASDLLVHPGDIVEAGQAIGRVGRTGRATGAHLHFEVRHDSRPRDPTRALNEYRLRADDRSGAGSRLRSGQP
ncbi:MAG TPA: peptidoglycan DD-metalloendopeptidase family protein [Anaeromyxobacteraceae bacterium]|nr:peptidoglycan DD-metalloendopeptidase family protein [Anaeromyxobacteraceae bacterium]